MKIVSVHNFYQQAGGEDQVFASEARMLEKRGHTVLRFTESNDRVTDLNSFALASATIWNGEAYSRLRALVERERPEIVHFHNTFPLLSPACYYAAREGGAAVVQTLHNYRLICPAATLLRDGHPCEDCVGLRVPWHGAQHRCYRGSRVASAGVVAMLSFHNLRGTWRGAVDAYVALTNFARGRFIAGNLPAERIFVKPNFAEPDPGNGAGGNYYLFAGRLSPEKGLDVLIRAWRELRSPPPALRIVGDGPLADFVREGVRDLPAITWLGRLPREQVLEQMRGAKALILPSIWYENFPVSIVEGFATGLPAIVSDAGALPEIVNNCVNGKVFRSGDSADLARKIAEIEDDSSWIERARKASRSVYEISYGEDKNYELLIEIYQRAQAIRGTAVPSS